MKVDKGLTDSIRFRRVVRKLRDSNALRGVTDGDDVLSVTIVLGAMVRFWAYADSHIDDDDVLGMTLDEINELVGVDGFAQALPTDWLKVVDADHVQLPDFVEHNGSSEKQRRANARRQAEYRHRRASHNVTRDVTPRNKRNDARPDQNREDKNREEQEKGTAAPRAADGQDGDLEFESLRALYPQRSGDQRWREARQAINARLREGHTWEQILDGARRYAAWCKATGKLNTETVKQAATFVGPGLPFMEPWALPATKADTRLAGNLSAADEFMRRTEAAQ